MPLLAAPGRFDEAHPRPASRLRPRWRRQWRLAATSRALLLACCGVTAGADAGVGSAGGAAAAVNVNASAGESSAAKARASRGGRTRGAKTRSYNADTVCRNGRWSASSGCVCSFPMSYLAGAHGGAGGCGIANCGHGNFSFELGRCVCERSWRVAGVTNPIQKFWGRCTQYVCESDLVCTRALGLESGQAACPLQGLNCDCGFWRAGFATSQAQCMYPWWALASKATQFVLFLSRTLWIVALASALCLLPFGKNVVGSVPRYSRVILWHDLAWSVFAIKACVWFYAVVLAAYVASGLLWVSILVSFVVVGLIAVAALAACAACGAVAGEGAGGCEVGGCAECCGADSFASCLGCGESGELCCCCCGGGSTGLETGPAMLYYFDPCLCYGPYPYYGDCCNCCGGCTCCRCFRGPRCQSWYRVLRVLTMASPQIPENMLGGLLGLVLGTHPRSAAARSGAARESRLVRLLTRPCGSMANRGEEWRQVVYSWLHERDAAEVAASGGLAVAEARPGGAGALRYGDVTVRCEAGVFTEAERMYNFGDYEENRCWICQDAGQQWDLWLSCRHAFCQRCSGEMLRRQMPCPLCRVRSSTVLRRSAAEMEAGAAGGAQTEPARSVIGAAADSEEETEGLLAGHGASGVCHKRTSAGASSAAAAASGQHRPAGASAAAAAESSRAAPEAPEQAVMIEALAP